MKRPAAECVCGQPAYSKNRVGSLGGGLDGVRARGLRRRVSHHLAAGGERSAFRHAQPALQPRPNERSRGHVIVRAALRLQTAPAACQLLWERRGVRRVVGAGDRGSGSCFGRRPSRRPSSRLRHNHRRPSWRPQCTCVPAHAPQTSRMCRHSPSKPLMLCRHIVPAQALRPLFAGTVCRHTIWSVRTHRGRGEVVSLLFLAPWVPRRAVKR